MAVQETKENDGYYDDQLGVNIISIMAGQCNWSRSNKIAFSTTLGSCLSVCAYDEHAGVGGMNHFLLPVSSSDEQGKFSQSFRYGSAAIESLLNALYAKGAAKNGMTIKIFGGAKVLNTVSQDIGFKNLTFARNFFKRENLRIDNEDIGGSHGRRVIFFPRTGRVLLKSVGDKGEMAQISQSEQKILETINKTDEGADIELF